ncbi:MAG: peptidase MA family metallohydrolase [Anaerolineae bacterium]|nr:peptidase MA family metallohydrolase [Anaerolineae bacterium]
MTVGTTTTPLTMMAVRMRTESRVPGLPPSYGRWCIGVLVTLVLVAALFLTVKEASAQLPDTTHEYTFGQIARFRLALPRDTKVRQATLYLQINDDRTVGLDTHVTEGQAEVVRNLVSEPLPPYAQITTWWGFTGGAGDPVETERVRFQYVDNRYAWQTAEGDNVAVHWVTGERSLMIQAVDVAEAALSRFKEALSTERLPSTSIYIYPSQSDLASAMQLAGFDWAGGVAYPELGVVLVAIPPSVEAPVAMQQDIPHELAHQSLYAWLGPQGYASLPTWLNEGLAMAFEARPDPTRAVVLQEARRDSTMIPLAELCLPFPDDPQRAQLAYAQSERVVAYLRQSFGWSGLRRLILAYADGKACSAGLQEGLGQDLVALDRAWQVSLMQEQSPVAAPDTRAEATLLWRDAGPWLVLLAALVLPGLTLIARRR